MRSNPRLLRWQADLYHWAAREALICALINARVWGYFNFLQTIICTKLFCISVFTRYFCVYACVKPTHGTKVHSLMEHCWVPSNTHLPRLLVTPQPGFLHHKQRRKECLPCVLQKVLVTHSCPILCDPIDCSPPSSSVHGILQARILEWAAISYSRGSSWIRDRTWVSCTASRFFIIWATRDALLWNTLGLLEGVYTLEQDCWSYGMRLQLDLTVWYQIALEQAVTGTFLPLCSFVHPTSPSVWCINQCNITKQYHIVILICIFLNTNEFEHLGICLLFFWGFPYINCLFTSSVDNFPDEVLSF